MARYEVKNPLTPEGRNQLNAMFEELYKEYIGAGNNAKDAREKAVQAVADSILAKDIAETTRQEMLAIIREQTKNGDLAPEIAQARGGKQTLGERFNSVDSQLAQTEDKADVAIAKSTDALAKSDNPLATLQANGEKVSLDLFAQDVIDAMTGTTPITDAKGLNNNSGVIYPLALKTRNGILEDAHKEIKDAVLDAKVINAKFGKYYRLQYIGNGTTSWGNPFYGLYIYEHDKSTFATDSQSTAVQHVSRTNYYPTNVSGVYTHVIKSMVDDTTYIVTIDYNKLNPSRLYYNLDDNLTNWGYSTIIDESCYVYKNELPQKIDKVYNLAVKRVGSSFLVKYKFNNGKNIVIEFGELGINKITHPIKFYWDENKAEVDLDFDNLVEFDRLGTDWISPYGIMAKENVVSSGSFTVGGAHGTSGGGGFATAVSLGAQLFADGKLVNNGEILYCNNVVIKSIHDISASNAIDTTTGDKRSSVRETVIYSISKNNIEASVSLEALEPVSITRYAGLQATRFKEFDGNLYVPNDNNVLYPLTDTTGFESKAYPNFISDRFVIEKGNNVLVGYMDKSIGLGSPDMYKADGEVGIYLTHGEFGKVYFHNIKGVNVEMAQGDLVYYSGGYTIMEKLYCTYAQAAYVIYLHGKRIYCVDFFRAVNKTYLYPLPEDYNKKITVLDKNSTVTVDDYISGRGLGISTTGAGQVKFVVE